MKFRIVTAVAFLALFVGTVAATVHTKVGYSVWLGSILIECVFFPWFGFLLGRRHR